MVSTGEADRFASPDDWDQLLALEQKIKALSVNFIDLDLMRVRKLEISGQTYSPERNTLRLLPDEGKISSSENEEIELLKKYNYWLLSYQGVIAKLSLLLAELREKVSEYSAEVKKSREYWVKNCEIFSREELEIHRLFATYLDDGGGIVSTSTRTVNYCDKAVSFIEEFIKQHC